MDVVKFQNMLNDICALAQKNNKRLTLEQVRTYFAETDLTREQFGKILQYLTIKGIQIEEMPDFSEEASEIRELEDTGKERVPLTVEEEEYFESYLRELSDQEESEKTNQELFEALAAGDEMARVALTQRYLRTAAELAVEKNCNEIHVADLIQEANISLLTALGEMEAVEANEAWLLEKIRKGIDDAVKMQTERKFADDCLVAKVEKLEAAVRELSEEDEDEETQFSVEELAIILDMDADEIRGVLRLTGDDK